MTTSQSSAVAPFPTAGTGSDAASPGGADAHSPTARTLSEAAPSDKPPRPSADAANPADGDPPDPLHPGAGVPAWAKWAIAAAAMVLHTGTQWVTDYPNGCDEGHMLQAATRLARGDGLTVTWLDSMRDVAEPEYRQSIAWPPVFGWCCALLMKLGLPFDGLLEVVRLLRSAAAFFGTAAWIGLGSRLLPTGAAWMFALIVPSMAFAGDFLYGPSHLYLWAVVPLMVGRLIDGLTTGSMRSIGFAGLWAMVGLSARYSALASAPAGGLACLLLFPGGFWKRVGAGFAFGLPLTVCAAGFFAYNRFAGGSATWFDEATDGVWTWEHALDRKVLTSFFHFGFGLEATSYKLRPSWETDAPFAAFLPWYGLWAVVGVWGVRRGWSRLTGGQRALPAVALLLNGMVACMLLFMSLRQGPGGGWVALSQVRYFSEVAPLTAILWLLLLSAALPIGAARSGLPVFRPASAAVVWLLVFAVVGFACRSIFHDGRLFGHQVRRIASDGPRDPGGLVHEIRRRLAESPLPAGEHRIFDVWEGCVGRLVRDDGLRARKLPLAPELSATSCSRPQWVVAIVRWSWLAKERTVTPRWETNLGLALVRTLKLRRVGAVLDGARYCEVWTGVVEPFAPGARAPLVDHRLPPRAEWPTAAQLDAADRERAELRSQGRFGGR